MVDTIKHLCFSGGGMRCLCFCSAIKVLEEHGIRNQIRGFVGSSGGAITAALLAVGYTADEITEILKTTDFNKFKESSWSIFGAIYQLFYYFGLYDTNYFESWFGGLLKKKTGNEGITFKELLDTYGIELVITGTSLTKRLTHYYNAHQHPDMPIKQAVRISMSYPIFFKPVVLNDELLADGGIIQNFPLEYFIKKNPEAPFYETIGFNLLSEGCKPNGRIYYGRAKLNNITDYCENLIDILQLQIERLHIHQTYWERTVSIFTGDISALEFTLTEEQKQFLLEQGRKSTLEFLDKINMSSTN